MKKNGSDAGALPHPVKSMSFELFTEEFFLLRERGERLRFSAACRRLGGGLRENAGSAPAAEEIYMLLIPDEVEPRPGDRLLRERNGTILTVLTPCESTPAWAGMRLKKLKAGRRVTGGYR